ncbi:MAG: outer membrane beta-barrel family protein [Bacteroidota bacterium]
MEFYRFHLFCLCLLLSVLLNTSFAQVTGRITEENGEEIVAANVLVYALPDSNLMKGQISKQDGSFAFHTLRPGTYLLQVNMVGFNSYQSNSFTLRALHEAYDLGKIVLEPKSVQLEEVEISAQKQLFEQKIDRLVVNVASSATAAGNTALEVLERAPGVILDRSNNNLSLAGKDGVIVMINGKRNYMPISGVIQLLGGMSAEEIDKVELITTPPANFDAEGNAGYINIVLKENSNYGFNGSTTVTTGYGRGERANANVNLNYRRNKFNVFGTYSFLLNGQEQRFEAYRTQNIGDQVLQVATVSDRDPTQLNHNVRFGMDYQLSKKTVIGILGAGYDTKWTMDAFNTSSLDYSSLPDTLINLDVYELNQWRHYMGNFNIQHKFSENSNITFNADYLYYRDNNPTTYDNTYLDEGGNTILTDQLRSGKVTPIRIAVGTLDYTTQIKDKVKLETGIKATLSRFTNDVEVSNFRSEWMTDPSLTGIFFLKEEIGAAYAAIETNLTEKIFMKAGLRYEYTQSNLSSEEEENIVDRTYGNFFPSIFLTRNIGETQSINLSYSRRITRPTFNDMAPFVQFLDPTTFFSGNAALQPSISDAIKLDYRIKTFMFSLSYTYEDSTIARFQARIDPETNRQITNATNLKSTETINLSATFPLKLTDWWDMQYNLNGTYGRFQSYFDNELVTVVRPVFNGFTSQKFKLPKGFHFEVSGFYRSPFVFGTVDIKSIWQVGTAVRKTLGKDGNGGTLTFNVNDLFNSLKFVGETNLPEFNLVNRGVFDFSQRTFLLTYSKPFGSSKVRAARQRNTASEEERGRVTN